MNAQLLINYDLPASRELHMRRIAAILGATQSGSHSHSHNQAAAPDNGGSSAANAPVATPPILSGGVAHDAGTLDAAAPSSSATPSNASAQQGALRSSSHAPTSKGDEASAARSTSTIHFIVAGQMAQFRALERFTHAAIHEMPVHAADILGAA